jgi:hypothetical protein
VAEARKFGLGGVLAPRPADGAIPGQTSVETVRAALKAAGARGSLKQAA